VIRRRWLLTLVVLAVASSIALFVVPFSSSNGNCGLAAFPRYNRASPHADERWCGDNTYDARRSAATWLVVGTVVLVGGAVAFRRDRARR
jgi:hypothetical protein